MGRFQALHLGAFNHPTQLAPPSTLLWYMHVRTAERLNFAEADLLDALDALAKPLLLSASLLLEVSLEEVFSGLSATPAWGLLKESASTLG